MSNTTLVWYDGNDNYNVIDNTQTVLYLNDDQLEDLSSNGNAKNHSWYNTVKKWNLNDCVSVYEKYDETGVDIFNE